MDNRRIFIYIAIVFVLTSCGELYNPKERNILSFNSDFDSVFSSIKEMNHILDSSNIDEYFFMQ